MVFVSHLFPTLPAAAVLRDGQQRFVYLADGQARVRQEVTVGWSDGSMVEITAGLEPGQQVLAEARKELEQ
jgi:multidrug efflux pump subunit AcrA (membrane-fusion protein)